MFFSNAVLPDILPKWIDKTMSVADNIKHCQNIYMYYMYIILKIYISIKNFEALKTKISDFKDYNESVVVPPPPPQIKTLVIIVNENFLIFS